MYDGIEKSSRFHPVYSCFKDFFSHNSDRLHNYFSYAFHRTQICWQNTLILDQTLVKRRLGTTACFSRAYSSLILLPNYLLYHILLQLTFLPTLFCSVYLGVVTLQSTVLQKLSDILSDGLEFKR